MQGRALLLPNLNLTANGELQQRSTRSTAGTLPKSRPGTRSTTAAMAAALNLTQPLYRPQNNVVYEQAKIQVSQAETQLSQAGQDLMLRVSQAYFDVLLAEYELRTVEAQKAATAEQLAQAKRNFEVGTATITDTYDAQARFDLIVAREIATRNDIEVRRAPCRRSSAACRGR